MGSLIATILVLALLVYIAWPWFWHIVTALALALLVYLTWPWFLQKPWEDLMSWLQQIQVPQQKASATNTPSGRLYVSPQRTDESCIHFEELGQEEYASLLFTTCDHFWPKAADAGATASRHHPVVVIDDALYVLDQELPLVVKHRAVFELCPCHVTAPS